MSMLWSEVAKDPNFEALSPEDKETVRNEYFNDVVTPSLATEHIKLARAEFDADTGPGGEIVRQQEEYEKQNPFLDRAGQRLSRGFKQSISSERATIIADLAQALHFIAEPKSAPFVARQQIMALSPEERQAKIEETKAHLAANISNYSRDQKDLAEIPVAPVTRAAHATKTFGEYFAAVKQAPVSYTADAGLTSLVQSLPALADSMVGGRLAGKKGGIIGGGAGSFNVDYAAELSDLLTKGGVDARDPEQIKEALSDPQFIADAKKEAGLHASVVGLLDGLSFGLASKTMAPAALGTVARKLTNVAVQTPVQGVLGAAGEAGGELAAGQELSPANIGAEFVGEMFQAPGDVAGATISGLRDGGSQSKAPSPPDPDREIAAAVTSAPTLDQAIETAGAAAESPPQAALPAPDVIVSPDGEAGTTAQIEARRAERIALGLTPDVERAVTAAQARENAQAQRSADLDATTPVVPKNAPAQGKFLRFLSERGGISRPEAEAQGIAPAHFKDISGRQVFGKPLFPASGGMSFDAAAELAGQFGYGSEQYSANEFLSLLDSALQGQEITSRSADFEDLNARMEFARNQHFEQLEASPDDPGLFVTTTDIAVSGYNKADEQTKDLSALFTAGRRALGEDEFEAVLERAAATHENATDEQFETALRQEIKNRAKATIPATPAGPTGERDIAPAVAGVEAAKGEQKEKAGQQHQPTDTGDRGRDEGAGTGILPRQHELPAEQVRAETPAGSVLTEKPPEPAALEAATATPPKGGAAVSAGNKTLTGDVPGVGKMRPMHDAERKELQNLREAIDLAREDRKAAAVSRYNNRNREIEKDRLTATAEPTISPVPKVVTRETKPPESASPPVEPKRISQEELARKTQAQGDRDRIARAKRAISDGEEVSAQDARAAGVAGVPAGYVEKAGRYVPEREPSQKVETKAAEKDVAEEEKPEYSATDTAAFRKWFGKSKVVDESGEPLVVYHGTKSDFMSLRPWSHFGSVNQAQQRLADIIGTGQSVFTTRFGEGDFLIPAYLALKNPLRLPDVGTWTYKKILPALENVGVISHGQAKMIASKYEKQWRALKRKTWEHRNGYEKIIENKRPILEQGLQDIEKQSVTEVQKLIEEAGFDGIVYKNEGEVAISEQDSYIAFRPEQIKSAIGNRGTFDPDDANILRDIEPSYQAPIFYSQMQRVLDEKLPNSGSPKEMKNAVAAYQLKGQIKKEELEWSGLREFLDEQAMRTKKITKDEVLDFLRANEIKISEVIRGSRGNTKDVAELRELLGTIEMQGYNAQWDESVMTGEHDVLVAFEKPGPLRNEFRADADFEGMPDDLRQKARRILELSRTASAAAETTFEQYTLPGGENYTELLLTLPNKSPPRTIKDFADAKYGLGHHTQAQLMAISDEYQKLSSERKQDDFPFQSTHFNESNILAHVRFNERTDADGKRVLFLEEIQSDWAQKGKREGFRDAAFLKAQAEFDVLYDERDQLMTDAGAGIPGREPHWTDGQRRRGSEIQQRFDELHRDFPGLSGSVRTTPSAPFVTKTDSWVSLAVRRMIRWGAENGFDRIAWTTGEQQADRYDLSKHISEMIVYKKPSGKIDVRATAKQGGMVIDKQGIEQSELVDIVGKDLAEKIEKQPRGYETYSGLDLKVGGEGMKAFYDQMLPSIVNKYVKKWGARVGETEFRGHSQYGPSGITREQEREEQAARDVGKLPFNAHSFDITEAMRESVMQGQPIVASPKPEYNPDQYDFFKNATQAQKKLAGEAITDLRVASARRAPTRLLASRIPAEFAEKGRITLIGQKIATPEDLAVLAQVYRDPRFETFRYIFLKGDTVVGQTGFTSRLPGFTNTQVGASRIESRIADAKMVESMRANGADGYYMLHNHPSGRPIASEADIRVTDIIKTNFRPMEFKGHVIIDESSYGLIGNDLRPQVIDRKFSATPYNLKGGTPRKPHFLLGKKIESLTQLADTAKQIETAPGYFVLIGNSHDGVRGIMEVPNHVLANKLRAIGILRRFARDTGSLNVFAVNVPRDAVDIASEAIAYDVLQDAIVQDSGPITTLRGMRRSGTAFGGKIRPLRVESPRPPYDDTRDTQSDVQALNNAIARQENDDKYKDAYLPATLDNPELGEAFRETFGTPVVAVRPRSEEFNIFLAMQHGGKIYVNVENGRAGFVQLAGHELLHDIRKNKPSLYAYFEAQAKNYIEEGAESNYRSRLEAAGADQLRTDTLEEILADFVGDSLADPVFLKHLAEGNKSKFRLFVDYVINWLRNVSSKLTKAGFGSYEYINDVRGLQSYLGAVLDAYKRQNDAGAIDSVDPVKFSRTGDIQTMGRGELIKRGRALNPNFNTRQSAPAMRAEIQRLERARPARAAQPPGAPPAPPGTPPPAAHNASWDSAEPDKLDRFIRVVQDKHIDTKRVTQAIKNATGALDEIIDVYLKEELFHERTAKRTRDFLDFELRPLFTEMSMRGITMPELEDYLHARHAEERNEAIARINTELPDGGSGMDTAEAREYLENLDAKEQRAFEALAKRVDGITRRTRQTLIDYNLEVIETIQAWEDSYQSYVPLHREDMDSGPGIGQGFSVRGPASKRATGSRRTVVDIIANIAIQRERAIVRGEKNRVSNALVGLATENPNTEFWRVDEPPMQSVIDPRTGLVIRRIDPLYKTLPNVVVARSLGAGGIRERAVVFNKHNERAIRMSEALKNLDAHDMSEVLSFFAKITRYFASINTQYNPIFGVVNLTRDVPGSLLNLSNTPLAGRQAEITKYILPALRGIYIETRAARRSKKRGSAWSDLWEEFQLTGATTGYRDLFKTSRHRAEGIEREIKRVTEGRAKRFRRYVFDWLSDYNQSMENAVRLSVYKVGLESGLSKERSASIAKNITVNFNRRGQMGTQIGSLYAFFNAQVQGTARMLETLLGPAGKKIIAGGLLLGVVQALVLEMAGFDDDEPPEFVRQRNIIIPTGGKTYITIPMTLGFNILPNLGRIPTSFALRGFRDISERIVDLVDVVAEAFNPLGNAGLSLQTILPTALDPIAAIAENKDRTGRPIALEDFNKLAPTPGFTRSKETASAFSKATSRGLNWLSGGTQYTPGIFSPTPDQIDYLIGEATGGVGRETMKLEQSLTSVVTGEELPTYKIPLFGRFHGSSEGQAPQANMFYKNLRALNMHEAEIMGRREAREPVDAYRKAHPESDLIGLANASERAVGNLRRQRRDLLEKGATRDEIKLIESRITIAMKRLNDKVKEKRAKPETR